MTETHSIHIKIDSTDAQKATRNLSDMEKATNGAERALVNLTRGAIGLVALDKIGNVAKGILDTNRAMEALRAQLVAVTGSAVGAQRAFSFIQNFATSTPYEIDGLTKAFIMLQNYGIKPTKQVMEAVTNQASKLGASQETLDGIVRALGQAYAKGKLQAEEMLQLAERGVPVYDLLSQVTGKNAAQLQEMASKGELTRQTIEKLIATMNQAASGANAAAMDTLNGKISNLSDAWHQFEDALLNDKSEGIIKDIVDGITAQINRMTASINMNPVQKLEAQLASLRKTPGYDVPIAEVERQLEIAKKAQAEQDKITAEQNKAEDERVAKAEEARKKLLGADQAVTKSKKQQTAETKALHEAEAAYTATIEANLRAVQDRNKVQDAQTRTAEKRLQIELEQAKASADIQMQSAKGDQEKIKIQDELAKKYESIIVRETELRQEQIAQDEQLLQSRIAAVEQEIAMADRYNLSQVERIRLRAELQSLQTQQEIIPEERAQVELEAMRELQNAYAEVNKLKAEAADGEAKVREEALRTLEVLSSNLEYSREVARGLAEAFGEVGAAIGGMSVAMAEYDKQSATIEIARKEAVDKAEGDQKRITEINDDATKKQAKAEIKKYGDMAQAAQGFFKKNTAGYKAMETATKAFRAVEIAQSAMAAAKQLSDTAQVVGSAIAAIFTETAANTASVAPNVAADSAKAAAAGTDAVAKAAAAPFPIGFVTGAAMLAFMVAIGAMSGGGGGGSAPAIPEVPTGAGTVKGDPMAQSESISKSLAILEENSSNDLNYSADMLEALLAIKSALAGVEKQIANTLMPAISDLTMKYGTDALKQAGFLFRDQKLTSVLASGKLQGYIGARIETESEDGIKKGQNLIAGYGPKFAKLFGDTIKTVVTSIEEAGKSIGVSEGEIRNRLTNFVISLGKINVAGMNAEEAAKQVEAAISAMSDSMAEQALPEFKEFWRSGEGYKETIVRVAEGIQRATGSLELLGMEAINYTEITDKQKDVAAEITRQTIMAQGDLSEGTKEYVRQLQGGAEDIISSYKQILSITNLMRGAGFGSEDIDRTMINAAGGLSAFEEALQSFRDNFMSDEQKVAADTAELTKAFAKLGYTMPKSKDEFYAIAMGMDKSTEQGKELFAQFMGLNEKFSDLTDASKDLADAQAEAAQQAADAAQKTADAAKKAREDLIAGLQKTVDTALSDMKKAYADLQKVQDRFIKLSQNLKNYLDDITGAASPYTSPEDRYRIARVEFRRVAELARSGNEEALGSLATASKDLLTASREYNASSEQFQADFASVTQAIQDSMAYTQSQVDLAAEQLAYAEASYSELATINGSVISVAQGIAALNSSMASYTSAVAALAKENAPIPMPKPTPTPTPMPKPTPKPTPVAPIQAVLPFIPGGAAGSNYFANNNKYKYSDLDAENIIRFYYNQLLGRNVESVPALKGWAGNLTSGAKTTNEIAQIFKQSPEYLDLVGRGFVPGFAKGGMAYPGLALVGEEGPELVSFGTQAHVSTASQTQGFFSGLQASIEKGDADQTNELQALVRLQSAANQQLIKEMKELKGEMAELARKAKIEAAA